MEAAHEMESEYNLLQRLPSALKSIVCGYIGRATVAKLCPDTLAIFDKSFARDRASSGYNGLAYLSDLIGEDGDGLALDLFRGEIHISVVIDAAVRCGRLSFLSFGGVKQGVVSIVTRDDYRLVAFAVGRHGRTALLKSLPDTYSSMMDGVVGAVNAGNLYMAKVFMERIRGRGCTKKDYQHIYSLAARTGKHELITWARGLVAAPRPLHPRIP